MGHTSKTYFTDSTNWITTSLNQVFSGTFRPTSGRWNVIRLTTPFTYNNTNNLFIAVDENNSTYHGSADGFYCTNLGGTSRRTLRGFSNMANINPISPIPAGNTTSNCPNLKIYYH
ncbi:MAG: hypothetical protein L0Y76_11075, partial [Ignavibacteria bacterium]|nr:hypothetical protein [Ignavibacteria bacterium]